jgi:hypothetical protein
MAVVFGVDYPGLRDLAINRRQILVTLLRFMESLIYLLSKWPRLDSNSKVMLQNESTISNSSIQDHTDISRSPISSDWSCSIMWYFSNLLKFRHVSLTSSRGCFSPSGAPGDKQFYMSWASYHSISNCGVLRKSSKQGIKQPWLFTCCLSQVPPRLSQGLPEHQDMHLNHICSETQPLYFEFCM